MATLGLIVVVFGAAHDPIQLYDPATSQAYDRQEAQEILRFRLLAQ